MAANKECFIPQDFKSKKRFRKSTGFWSSSMGVGPDQVADELTRHPDWRFDSEGKLWVENYADQKKKAKELGFEIG